jgi:methylthioribulose-1-phosphate dehydratase
MTRPPSGPAGAPTFAAVARELAAIGRRFHTRGWALGTSGNYSSVICDLPFQLAISESSVPKGAMRASNVLRVGEGGDVIGRRVGRPSAETLVHLEIVRRRGAHAVLHTHSVWSTMLSDAHADLGGLEIADYEMLKGLQGVATHDHREWIPIIANDQDMARLAREVGMVLERDPAVHAILLRRHGLYTWGRSLDEAERHVEILEFLFETLGRTATYSRREAHRGNTENS